MANEKTFRAWINPLVLFGADAQWGDTLNQPITCESVLQSMCAPGLGAGLGDILLRYEQIREEGNSLFTAPADPQILEKLVWPLRHAKVCYMLGNYLGTISLCGMVAEMVAILRFEVSTVTVNGQPIDVATQKELFGSSFERLGQDRRVAILHAYNLITDEVKSHFDAVRNARRGYLHFYSKEHERLPAEAVEVYRAATELVTSIIGNTFRDGKVVLAPALVAYLESRGMAGENVGVQLWTDSASEAEPTPSGEPIGETLNDE